MAWPTTTGVAPGQKITAQKIEDIIEAFPDWGGDVHAHDYELKFLGGVSAKASDYDFTPIAPGGSLTGGSPATVTLPNVPPGVNGTDVGHYLYISGGTGTAEAVPITGGTAVSEGGNQTIEFTPANNHSGAWTISSATGGVQEAINEIGEDVMLPDAITLYGPVSVPAPVSNRSIRIRGAGRFRSIITIDPSFPTGVNGVFICASGEPGLVMEECTISFTQPDSVTLGDYTQWPPVIYAPDCPRLTVRNVSMWRCWDGIKALGNTGGACFEGIWLSAFGKGIQIDGSLDTVRVTDSHFWPFGCTANQITAFLDADVLAMEIGRLDDLKVRGCLFLCGSSIRFWDGAATGGSFARVDACGFDTRSRMSIEKGRIAVSNSYFTGAPSTPTPCVVISGGHPQFSNCWFYTASDTQRVIDSTLGAATAFVKFTGCEFEHASTSTSHDSIARFASSAGIHFLQFTGCSFNTIAVAYTAPDVDVQNGLGGAGNIRLTFQGNTHTDALGGTTWVRVVSDDLHRMFGNVHAGSSDDVPATKAYGIYQTSDTALFFPSTMTVTIPTLAP